MSQTPIALVLKQLIFEVMIKELLAKGFYFFPFLQWWWIRPAFIWLVDGLGHRAFNHLMHLSSFIAIDFEVNASQETYNKAVSELIEVMKVGEEKSVELAKEKFKEDLFRLITIPPPLRVQPPKS